ncbi:MAG: hypothetical protein HMLKMBBP_01280 [Planctomycetes bacterium]|nr:hypothetical protein [Planctomycetota bacterium]
MPRPTRRAVLAALALVAASAAIVGDPRAPRGATAACLAPTDVRVDDSGAVGPFWGNESGALLHVRNPLQFEIELVLRPAGSNAGEVVARQDDANDFYVGLSRERWRSFNGGTLNATEDFAFSAVTYIPDDPGTPEDESLPRRGAYAQRGNTMYEVARATGLSPFDDGSGGLVLWQSIFDVAACGRDPTRGLVVVFSAQLGAPDGRTGIFAWDEASQSPVPLVFAGDPAPEGGVFHSFGRIRVNEAGDLAFSAAAKLGDAFTAGMYLLPIGGAVTKLVATGDPGDPAPGGGSFALLTDFDLAADRTVAFSAELGNDRTGLFRASPPGYAVTELARTGDGTPIGGTFESFSRAIVRIDETGDIAFVASLSGGVGDGLFNVPAGTTELVGLGIADGAVTGASVGLGRMAYQTEDGTHVIAPADGDEEGPGDFRVHRMDFRNSVKPRADTLRVEGSFRLPPWGTGPGELPPAAFRGDAVRETPAGPLTGGGLTRVREARIAVSQSPGQELAFSIGGTDGAPTGSGELNGDPLTVKKLVVAADGGSAAWTFESLMGNGTFTVDLSRGTFALRTSRGDLFPSFEPERFRVALTLRSDGDVQGGRTGDDAVFHRDVRLDCELPRFPAGRRILSDGSAVTGGGLVVDALRVTRKLRALDGGAVVAVDSDAVALSGTLRICPGSTAPVTPTVEADLTLDSIVAERVVMSRVGKSGSRYRWKGDLPGVPAAQLDIDAVAGTFTFRAKGASPLPSLVDADFRRDAAVNSSRAAVGGMSVPFSLRVDRVFEDAYDIAMARRPGGKRFEK